MVVVNTRSICWTCMRSSLSSPRGMSINDMHLQERTIGTKFIGWNIKISKAQWPFMINLKMVVNENTKCAVKRTLIWIERLVFIHIQRCTLLWYVITFYNDVDSVYLLFMNHILTLFKTTPLWLESFLYNGWMWTCWCCEFCLTVVESYPERKFYKFRRPEAQISRSDSKLTHNQLETSLQSNAVSLWLGKNLKLAKKALGSVDKDTNTTSYKERVTSTCHFTVGNCSWQNIYHVSTIGRSHKLSNMVNFYISMDN